MIDEEIILTDEVIEETDDEDLIDVLDEKNSSLTLKREVYF